MDDTRESRDGTETSSTPPITVRYWAAAKAAAGVETDLLSVEGPVSLAEVLRRVHALRPDPRLERVVGVCSILVGDRPVSSSDAEDVVVDPGSSVELLPPFAGG